MNKPAGQAELRILMLEDEPTDAALAEEALREAGLSFTSKRVDTRETFIRALEEFKPDIVLADYKLPAFDGASAVKIVRQQYPTVPVVMVTGAMGDEKAIELLGLGARDYILKDRLARLGSAVQRALSAEQGIRARKAAEKALRDSEAELRAIFDGALDGIVLADRETMRLTTVNPAFCHMLGYSPEELTLLSVSDIHTQQDLPHAIEQFEKLLRGEIQLATDIPVKRKDGSVFYADIKGSSISFDGKPFLMGVFRDITERKAAELRLLEQELQYRTLADSGQALIWASGTDKLCNYFNQPWLKFTGRSLEHELGNGWAEGVHPDDFAQCLATYVAAFDRREPFSMAYRLRRHDGEYRWIQDDGCPRYNAEGEFIGYIGYCLDITERKNAEVKLSKSEQHFRAVTESANDAIITGAGAGNIIGWNAAAERLFGYSEAEIIGQPLTVLMPERFRNLHREGLARVMAGGAPHVIGKTVELAGLRKDGSEFPLEISLAQWQTAGGQFFTAIIRDITGRKQAEQKLSESEKLYRSLFENMLNGFAYCQMLFEQDQPQDFIYLSVNTAFETLTGLKNPIGKRVSEIIPGIRQSDPKMFEMYGRVSRSGKPERFEIYVKAMQQWFWVSVYSPEKDYFVAIFDVITERKQAEARIQKLTRLYATLSQTNQTIVRTTNREELFCRICENAVTHGKFVLAWVGLVDEATHRVKPACHYGAGEDYLANIVISTDDVPAGRGPTGAAIRENCVSYVNDYATDERTLPWREAALKRGFCGAAGLPLRFKGKAIGALTLYTDEPDFFDADQLNLLEEMATDISFALEGFEREAQRRQAEEGRETALGKLRKALEGSIGVAASISEMRDPYTAGHQQRVGQLAAAIAIEMGLPEAQVEGIRFGSLIHDIGKIGVPAEILSKPSRLTPLEMQLIQIHPKAGYEIVKDIEFPWPVAQMILQHHERLDGSGYPAGLKGDDLLLEAKIIAVADTIEAMSSHRPYRPGLGMDAALAEITGASGVRYDQQAVEACVRLIRENGFTFNPD